jgi:hypothetical protein
LEARSAAALLAVDQDDEVLDDEPRLLEHLDRPNLLPPSVMMSSIRTTRSPG